MKLETERMILEPLTLEQLRIAKKDLASLVRTFGVEMKKISFLEKRNKQKIYRIKSEIITQQPRTWLLSTMFFMFDKEYTQILGEVGFKGPPYCGEIEIGYFTYEDSRGKGYMTEAVAALLKFAFSQTDYLVSSIVATTLPKNYASHKVLEKNGFKTNGMRGEFWLWEKKR